MSTSNAAGPSQASPAPDREGRAACRAAGVSLILHTRDTPRLLRAVLRSVARQRACGFEVLVADDGGPTITRDVVREFELKVDRIPVRHLVLPAPRAGAVEAAAADRSAALQAAFVAARGDYLVVLGRGQLLHPDLLVAHLSWRARGRVLVAPPGPVAGDDLAERLLDGRSAYRADPGWLLRHALRGELEQARRGVVARAPWLRRWLRSAPGSVGEREAGHYGLYASDLLGAHGVEHAAELVFDEASLGRRLAATGVSPFDASNLAITCQVPARALRGDLAHRAPPPAVAPSAYGLPVDPLDGVGAAAEAAGMAPAPPSAAVGAGERPARAA